MLKQIKTVAQELKRGENLDLYLIIFLALVIAVLGVLGVANFAIVSATILATLGLLAGSLLQNRRTVIDAKDATTKLSTDLDDLKHNLQPISNPSYVLLEREYPDLSAAFRSAKKISILGASLHSTTTQYYADFEEALKHGALLRVLVCEPSPNVLSMQCFRTYMIKDPDMLGKSVHAHLSLLRKLKQNAPKPDSCESRTIPLVIPYGLIILETPEGTSTIYTKLMPFRTRFGKYPAFQVNNHDNKEWFQFFYEQFEKLWNASDDAA